jgi:GDP-mannose 6-dehydrogenase
MNISIFGLGQIGTVSAGCLASLGHQIVGVDVDAAKVRAFALGHPGIAEPGVETLLGDAIATGRLRVTVDAGDAVDTTDLSLICVGTPTGPDGAVDLRQVIAASHAIGTALRRKRGRHVVVVRSTVLPGTLRGTVASIIESTSGKRRGIDFGLAAVPEFLRQGSAVDDFFNPSQVVIGIDDEITAAQVVPIFRALNGPLTVGSIESAELVKYVANTWHGLKVAFANEVGVLCRALAIDGREVMNVFAGDIKLNLSRSYLRPGFAFGGPCLEKDIKALAHCANTHSLDLPLTASILRSNDRLIGCAVDRIMASGLRQVSLLGFTFKAETGDLNGSAYVALAYRLMDSGIDLRVFDPHANFGAAAANEADHASDGFPRIHDIAVESMDQALAHGALVVLGTPHRFFADARSKLKSSHMLIDLNA